MNVSQLRPTSVTVFGILNLVFGAIGLMATAGTAAMQWAGAMPQLTDIYSFPNSQLLSVWTNLSLAVGLLSTAVLIASGIGLLRLRSWGRTLALFYALLTVVITFTGMVLQWFLVVQPLRADGEAMRDPAVAGALFGAIGGIVGGAIGLIFPILLWYFMTRPRVIAAFEVASGGVGAATAATIVPHNVDLENPYSSPAAHASAAWTDETESNSVANALIPSKNSPALAAYYLGLFSLLPCLGFPLGVAAVYFGVQGLRRVRQTPEVRGGVHAWVGIVCGGLFGLFNLLLIGLAILGMVAAAMDRR